VGLIVFPRPARSADWLEWLGIAPVQAQSRLVISVEAVYPGASARVLADTVAAPIEQQVNGVENMQYMRSRCTNEGRYTLRVTFREGVDANMVQVLVQNRVALALPMLPGAVVQPGITVKKISPGPIMIVILRSPDGSRDIHDLSNAATVGLRDELLRLPGIGEVTCFGCSDCGVRIKLDPEKMAANNVTACDVAAALREQDTKAAAKQVRKSPAPGGGGFQYTITGIGRLTDAEQLRETVLKSDAGGHVIRLKDVAGVEVETGSQGRKALLSGKPVAALAVYPVPKVRPRQLSTAVQARLTELRASFAKGVDTDVSFDFTPNLDAPDRPTTPEYLLLDLVLPSGATAERTLKVLTRCQELLHEVAGVQYLLALSENPFDPFPAQACLLVRLAPAGKRPPTRERIVETVRSRLAQLSEVTVRVRDLSGPGGFLAGGYPVDMAIYGPEEKEVGKLAVRLAKRLRESKKLTDVWADSELEPTPQTYVDIDRTKAASQGVAVSDIDTTLQVAYGRLCVNEFNRCGLTWPVWLESDSKKPVDIGKLAVRGTSGQIVPLGDIVSLRMMAGPTFIERLDLDPMVEVSANPAAGVSLAQVHALCETLLAEIRKELGLSEGYRLSWL
jgi:multidrug efflux pump subunit AcrB